MQNAQRHRVVVIGGGFGGIAAVQNLKGADLDITIIDRRNHHLFQPLLYQVATTALAPSEIAWPIRYLLRQRGDVRTCSDSGRHRYQGAGRAARRRNPRSYDSLIIATGARHAYFGHDDWEPNAPGLKTLEDATAMRRRLLLAFARARTRRGAPRSATHLVIIGAGPTGVELAGAIAELARTTLRDEFRSIDPATARVILIEAGPRVLANFRPSLSDYAKRALEKLGVRSGWGTPVTDVTHEGVRLNGSFVSAANVIWAAGVLASPAAGWLGAEADKAPHLGQSGPHGARPAERLRGGRYRDGQGSGRKPFLAWGTPPNRVAATLHAPSLPACGASRRPPSVTAMPATSRRSAEARR